MVQNQFIESNDSNFIEDQAQRMPRSPIGTPATHMQHEPARKSGPVRTSLTVGPKEAADF